MIGDQPRRLWCLSEASGRSCFRPVDYPGTMWTLAVDTVNTGRQLGTVLDVVGPFGGYSASIMILETFRVNRAGKVICSHAAPDTTGLGCR